MKKMLVVMCFGLSISLINIGYATPKNKTSSPPKIQYQNSDKHWYITFSAGNTWFEKPDSYNTAAASTLSGTAYYNYKKNKSKPILSLGGGYEWQRASKFWWPSYSLGLRYSYYSSDKGEGNYQVKPMVPPQTYAFKYKTQSQTLLAIGKLSILRWHNIMPYIIGGAGIALNKFSDYQDASNIFWPDNYHTFADKSSYSFAYLAGLGVDYRISKIGN